MKDDRYFMLKAIELAKKGEGRTSPNPLVGAVIVKAGKIVGQGYHRMKGQAHAEIEAINSAEPSDIEDSCLYLNLEPCTHYGKTPPCVDAIIKAKIKKVVIAMIDPNPLVKGKGVKRLKEAGIDVEVGLLQKEAIRLNEVYITYITKKRPFTILKMAMSLDGKIRSSKQRWISCELSRRYVQRLRNSVDAILVGKSTILADNPNLTINIKPVHKIPYKIVVDSKLQIDTSYNIFKEPKYLILATTELADKSKIKRLKALGVKVLVLPTKENKVDLTSLWQELAKLEISSVLLEGGARLAHSALWANLVDKVIFFIAPKFIGGEDINAVWGEEFPEWIKLKEVKHKLIGEDLMISGYINLPE